MKLPLHNKHATLSKKVATKTHTLITVTTLHRLLTSGHTSHQRKDKVTHQTYKLLPSDTCLYDR